VTLWIDPPAWPAHGRLWSHLVSDTSLEELHAFAAAEGIPRRGFEGDHYDVPEERYAALVAAGARPVSGRELVRVLHASGLRAPKRRHERVLHSERDPHWLPPGSRADVIASRQDGPPADTVVVRLLVHTGSALLVVGRDDGGGLDLPSRRVGPGTPQQALSALQEEVVGDEGPTELLGYVRNTVPAPDPGYPWPVPRACFTVFARRVDSARPFGGGHWLALDEASEHLAARHWWVLLPEFFSHPGAAGR
jgi:hypothetical protein